MLETEKMTPNARRVSFAKSCETDVTNHKEPIAVVAYASHDLTDEEAMHVLDGAFIENDLDAHLSAMSWAYSTVSDTIFASIEGRFLIDAYDRRRIAADRFARVIIRAKGQDPSAYGASTDRDNITEYVYGKLVESDDDIDFTCSSLDYFLGSLEPDHLIEIMPEFDHEQSLILTALLRHSRTAVSEAVEEEGLCDGGWTPFEIWRSLDIQTSIWRRHHAEIAAITSDKSCAAHLARIPAVASAILIEGKQGPALLLAAFIASVAAIGDTNTVSPSARVMTSIDHHGAIATRSREDA